MRKHLVNLLADHDQAFAIAGCLDVLKLLLNIAHSPHIPQHLQSVFRVQLDLTDALRNPQEL